MSPPNPVSPVSPAELTHRLRTEIVGRTEPVVVGLDGRSGSGKSTLAAAIARRLGSDRGGRPLATVVDGDQFYAGGSAESWDARSAEQNASRVIDWRRQRTVLEQLRENGVAVWHPFDWDADDWDAETPPSTVAPVRCEAAAVVLLDGAYSCRPELHDLLDLRVLLTTDDDVRRRRLRRREGGEGDTGWERRWSEAEEHYFGSIMPPARVDLVLSDGGGG